MTTNNARPAPDVPQDAPTADEVRAMLASAEDCQTPLIYGPAKDMARLASAYLAMLARPADAPTHEECKRCGHGRESHRVRVGNEPTGCEDCECSYFVIDERAAPVPADADKFKRFVHGYLDQHGVPHGDPTNVHQIEGCRIGARLDLMFAEAARLRDELAMSGECLNMVSERLVRHGCCHEGGDHNATPPMMYDDWISCAIAKREQEVARLRAVLVEIRDHNIDGMSAASERRRMIEIAAAALAAGPDDGGEAVTK